MINEPHSGTQYSEFIATICAQREVSCYLEIGVQNGVNLSKIKVDTAFGVDPDFYLTVDPTVSKKVLHLHRQTSDQFFREHSADVINAGGVDAAFLDGMHLFEFLLRDIYNTETCANPHAVIMLHDCLPFNGEMIERVNNPAGRRLMDYQGAWTGDVWKVIPILQKYRPDLRVRLVDCAPTGLVCITNLDPSSTVLQDNYLNIVEEFSQLPNDTGAIEHFYETQKLIKAADILSNYNHSIYFRT